MGGLLPTAAPSPARTPSNIRLYSEEDIRRLSAEAKQQRFLDDARTHEAALDEILTPLQQQRLKQIALQLQGMSAFHDAEVVAELHLTPDQKKRLRDVEADAFAPGPDPGKGPGDRGPRPEQGLRGVEKFVGGLTAEQKQRWQAMTGELFKARMGPPGPPPPEPTSLMVTTGVSPNFTGVFALFATDLVPPLLTDGGRYDFI